MEAVQGLLNVLACSRRQQTPTSTSGTSTLKQGKVKAPQSVSDTSSTYQSTDDGDLSNAELSDHSEPTARSQDGSDNESPLTSALTPMRPFPVGFISPPPGLESPDWHQHSTATRLNSHAPLFVPNSEAKTSPKPMRQTVSLLKGLLQECEANMPEANNDQEFSALQEALSRLTPKDAGVLKTFLDSRDSQQQQQPTTPPNDPLMQSWLAASLMGCSQPIAAMPTAMPMVQFPPGVYGVPTTPMAPPPGAFCYNPQPAMAPMSWTPPVAAAVQARSYTPFGAKPPGPIKPKKVAPSQTADDLKETLRTNLRDLSFLDHDRVLMVRKINPLGLESPKILEAYFANFGTVDRIMVSHSRAKSMFGRGEARVRPAGLGFLVMSTVQEVQAVLAAGTDHAVSGVTVKVTPFESRPIDQADQMGEVDDAQIQ